MVGTTAIPTAEGQPCPDPSAHTHGRNIGASSAASTAALLATKKDQSNPNDSNARDSPLGPDGKLSSRSAATSLKYAKPTDLPSFPSRGGLDSNDAGKAAMLAKDHKMDELWQPEASLAGSKAALLAHKDGGKLDLWQPSSTPAGQSAATLAMRKNGLSPQIDRGHTDAGRNNSLLAATKSHHMGRQRAGSMPVSAPPKYPDSHNSSRNALNAATVSHRQSGKDGWDSPANQAARLKNAHMDRDLFTEDPNIQFQSDIDEQRHQAALHASAASFARGVYKAQNRGHIDDETSSLHDGEAGAVSAHRRGQSTASVPDVREEALRYLHVQEAAQKLAQERLAKVDKDMEHGRYREYYGYPTNSPRKSRLSIRSGVSGGRKRANSEGQQVYDSDEDDDEYQARRIRHQMSQLSTSVATVSDKQRQDDRARLLAAAEKRVHAQMHDMDEKVFLDTGKPTQAMMEEWEAKAREKAERDREERKKTPGKTHIGGGKYMDDADIEAIALARLKPTFEELNDTAEKKRARDEELRVERDRAETARMDEKMKADAQKAEFKRIKEQDKANAKREKEERKAAQRAEKEEAKARKSQDTRKSREHARGEVAAVAGGAALAEVADKVKDDKEAPTAVAGGDARSTSAPAPAEASHEKSGRGFFDKIANRLKKHNEEKKSEEPKPMDTDRAAVVENIKHDNDAPDNVTVVAPGEATATSLPAEGVAEKDLAEHDNDDKAAIGAGVAAVGTAAFAKDLADKEEEPRSAESAGTFLNYRDDHVPVAGASSDSGLKPVSHEESPAAVPATTNEASPADVTNEPGEEEPIRSTKGKAIAATAGIAALGGIIAAGAISAERRHRESSEQHPEARDEVASLTSTVEDRETTVPRTPVAPIVSGSSVRPELERHISAIPDSDDDDADDESDDLVDSDDEVRGGLVNTGTLDEPSTLPLNAETHEEPPVAAPAPATTRDVETESIPPSAQLLPRDETGNVIFSSPATEAAAATAVGTAAAAPTVETGPSAADEPSQPPEKESKGLKGFFSKFKGGKSKDEKKLHKESPTVGKSTPLSDETSAATTPAAAPTQHIGTDGPIGDASHISGVGGDPRPASPSSFKRGEHEDRDLDDVSSSGADEDDYARGRGGGFRKRLGPARGKGAEEKGAVGTTGGEEGELERHESTEGEFEEARDHFDESLAPPPAFGGAEKTGSPSRGTKFVEEL